MLTIFKGDNMYKRITVNRKAYMIIQLLKVELSNKIPKGRVSNSDVIEFLYSSWRGSKNV